VIQGGGSLSIRATIAVPETHFDDVVRSARARGPAVDLAAVVAAERERLLAVAHNVLPATSHPDGCRVVLSTYPVAPEPRTSGPTTAADPPPAIRSVGKLLDEALAALARGDFAAVPREAWLAIIVLKTTLLVLFVLVGGGKPSIDRPVSQPRIDWATVDPDAADPVTETRASARVAA
jgi:hypothetical protein